MKARIFHEEGGDTEVFAIWDDSGKRSTEKNSFVFTGFSNKLHPYHKKQWNWVKLILATKGVILHHTIVPVVKDMTTDRNSDEITTDNLKLPKMETEIQIKNLQSYDGNIYVVVMDEEMGRGWAVFVVIRPDGTKEILQEDHRDIVLDWFMDGEFMRSMGIDYERKELSDLSKIPEDVNNA